MLLDAKETTVAYQCPQCGQTVVSMVGVFALSGDMIRLKCSCGESELIITNSQNPQDRRIRITTPCLVCDHPHNFTLAPNSFFTDHVMTFACPMTGLELCFVGKKDSVLDEASTANRHLVELMEEAGLTSLDDIKPKEEQPMDEDHFFITDVLNFLLCELKEDHAIHCRCADEEEQDIHFRLVQSNDDGQLVEIFCSHCGASVRFPISSANDAQSFLTTDSLSLT